MKNQNYNSITYDELIRRINKEFQKKINKANLRITKNNTKLAITNFKLGEKSIILLGYTIPLVIGSIPLILAHKLISAITYLGYTCLIEGLYEGVLVNGINNILSKFMPDLKRNFDDSRKRHKLSLKKANNLSSHKIADFNNSKISFADEQFVYDNLLTPQQQYSVYDKSMVETFCNLLSYYPFQTVFLALITNKLSELQQLSYAEMIEIKNKGITILDKLKKELQNQKEESRNLFHLQIFQTLNNYPYYQFYTKPTIQDSPYILSSNNKKKFTYDKLLIRLYNRFQNKIKKCQNKQNNLFLNQKILERQLNNPNINDTELKKQIFQNKKQLEQVTDEYNIYVTKLSNLNNNTLLEPFYTLLTNEEQQKNLSTDLIDIFDELLATYNIFTLTLCLFEGHLDNLLSKSFLTPILQQVSNNTADYLRSKRFHTQMDSQTKFKNDLEKAKYGYLDNHVNNSQKK